MVHLMIEVAFVVSHQFVWLYLALFWLFFRLTKFNLVPVFECVLFAKWGVKNRNHSCGLGWSHLTLEFFACFCVLWTLHCRLAEVHIFHLPQTIFKLFNCKLNHFLHFLCLLFERYSLRILQDLLYRFKYFCVLFILWLWDFLWLSFTVEVFSVFRLSVGRILAFLSEPVEFTVLIDF